MNIPVDDPMANALTQAIRNGEVEELGRILAAKPELATARLVTPDGATRTLLHIADWPGHFPKAEQTVRMLIVAGERMAWVTVRLHLCEWCVKAEQA